MTSTPSLTVRDARQDDIPAILELVHSAYRGDASRVGWTTEADLLDGLRADATMVAELIGRPDSVIMLFFTADPAAGEPIACCHVQRDATGSGYFGMFAVRPAAQGGGIGRFALAEAERLVAAWGCVRMRMTVISAREDLIAWYGRRGYRATGTREPFPYGDERFGQPKRPDLEFAELVKDLA